MYNDNETILYDHQSSQYHLEMNKFTLHADYQPAGDQPEAINALLEGIGDGLAHQTLLGVTGSGKTFTESKLAVVLPGLHWLL